MKEISLAAEERKGKSTNKELSDLRASSRIPGVIYGLAKGPVLIAVSSKELLAIRKKAGVNAVLHIKVGNSAETVVIKEIQWHPVTDRPVHADFQRISLTQKIEAKVPIELGGEAPGVKVGGGVLEHEFRFLVVKGVATKIPQRITVDVSAMEIGMHISVKDLIIPAELEVVTNPEQIVVHLSLPKVIEETPAPGAEAVAGAAGAEAAAEPEVASTKGKKDEEGKLIPKAAAEEPAKKGK